MQLSTGQALSYSGRIPNREILEILREQTEAWNRGDGVAWSKEFTDDCDFGIVEN